MEKFRRFETGEGIETFESFDIRWKPYMRLTIFPFLFKRAFLFFNTQKEPLDAATH